MNKHATHDPARDILNLMRREAHGQVKLHAPDMGTGQVLATADPDDGLIVQPDNAQTPLTDCLRLASYTPSVGDQVLMVIIDGEGIVLGKMA